MTALVSQTPQNNLYLMPGTRISAAVAARRRAFHAARLRAGALLFTLVVFVLTAVWQSVQVSELLTYTRALGEETAQVQEEHDALKAELWAYHADKGGSRSKPPF